MSGSGVWDVFQGRGLTGLPVLEEMVMACLMLVFSAVFLLWGFGRGRVKDVSSFPAVVLSQDERRQLRRLVLPMECVQSVKPSMVKVASEVVRDGGSAWDGVRALVSNRRRYRFDVEKYKAPRAHTPLLIFVNRKSGGQKGNLLLNQFRAFFPAHQVYDMTEGGGPETGLLFFEKVPNYRVLVAGGDGSVAWVLACIDSLGLEYQPPVGILPIGTGNDLARELGWGGGLDGSFGTALVNHLNEIARANIMPLDRWTVSFLTRESKQSKKKKKKTQVLNNYLGIGVDAQIALNFHESRERSPHLFTSRFVNKYIWYASSGGKEILMQRFKDFSKNVQLECDGEVVPIPPDTEGLILLNISCYGGGVDLWGNEDDVSDMVSTHDKRLEVVSVASSFQLGAAQVGLARPTRLCQCSVAKIVVNNMSLPVQVDGEPFTMSPFGEISVSYLNQGMMLCDNKRTGRISPSHEYQNIMHDVLQW
eukprot:CAMPEP_0203760952 /NCGR_PEP_ID=MMETSP0098-20131031/14132_1 /ASSEMBLY_ACC=CAM_ASM_000208 /TAXON_ID=96639 /ORGANISM=" , Strain NY0313808BC1" /LENGTH=476 /DNA_ID=CAMNT_0050654725 /DNA_START=245 /DNA_END=1672 /DNA_ORIENTATION=-